VTGDLTQHDHVQINVSLVRQLIRTQFPQWADLPVTPVEPGGWDNRTFRLGDEMSVRLPSAAAYVPQVEKEHQWLPRLAPHLPLPIPVPLAKGAPGAGFPWPWSIYRWIDGESASRDRITDLRQFALDLAQFLIALQRIDASGGPRAGRHNFYRGGPLSVYDHETRQAIEILGSAIDAAAATEVWETALTSTWHGLPVWVHGDVAVGNLLVKDGRLSAVIDFGSSGVGDPACDVVIAWTLLYGDSRAVFRDALGLDRQTWERGRGWALWKALITVADPRNAGTEKAAESERVIHEVLADHHRECAP